MNFWLREMREIVGKHIHPDLYPSDLCCKRETELVKKGKQRGAS
jgi:hypothetical protein